jgi:hypothetical protein
MSSADRVDRFPGGALQLRDLSADIVGGLGGLVGQVLRLESDHREALAGIPGTCRLDCRIQRQQVRLPGDVADQVDDQSDLLRANARTMVSVRRASATGFSAILADCASWRVISPIDEDSSSAEAATVCMPAPASSAAAATLVAWWFVSAAEDDIDCAVA